MLGILAKWLRILGYDTLYDNHIQDHQIIRLCAQQQRIALTRDTRLVQRRRLRRSLLIHSTQLPFQIREALTALGERVQPENILTRFLECNAFLQRVKKEDLPGLVPPYVYRTQNTFKRCPHCGKIYWGGTHRAQIYRRLKRWSSTWKPSPPTA